MRLKLKNPQLLVRAAKRLPQTLKHIVSHDVDIHFKNATAYVAGYSDWDELVQVGVSAAFPEAELSKLDEQCAPEDLALRREYQAARLAMFCAKQGAELGDAACLAVVQAWRPSAGRPQEESEAFNDQDRLVAEGDAEHCLRILAEVENSRRVPTPAEVDALIRGLRLFRGNAAEFVMTCIGPLAVRLVNSKVDPAASYGVRLLEALVANKFPCPVVSLAKALRNGWGTPEDHPRAWSLVSKALKAEKNDPELFIEPSAYIELHSLGGFLLMQGTNCRHNRAGAFQLYQRAAELGDGPAALFLTQFYMPMPDTGPDEYWGIVPPNKAKADFWFARALRAGYNPRTQTFSKEA